MGSVLLQLPPDIEARVAELQHRRYTEALRQATAQDQEILNQAGQIADTSGVSVANTYLKRSRKPIPHIGKYKLLLELIERGLCAEEI
jgi:hypothetical protein